MKEIKAGDSLSVNCADIPWKPSTWAEKVFVKDVAVAGGFEMQMLRLEAGAHLPLHTHELPEFIYLLEGELIVGGQRLSEGWASIAGVGSIHSDVHSDTGCVFLLVDRPV